MENQPGISLKNKPYFTDCVQWNQDGQLAICLDTHVHIMTPVLVGPTSKQENYTHVGFTLPPIQETTSTSVIVDPNNVQTSFFNDEGFRCAKWSSFGLSPSQSCVLIVVTTKHRVLLYQSSKKNPSHSPWQLIANITDQIEQTAIGHDHPTRVNPHHILNANWSKTLVSQSFATKSSLIALSNKAGDLVFWTYSAAAGPRYATTITPHNSFVNLLEWTSWKKIKDNMYIAFVASTSTNGTVALSSVKVEIAVDDQQHTQVLDVQAQILFTWFRDTPSVPTLLKVFDDLEHDKPDIKIAVCKAISVQFLHIRLEPDQSLVMCGEWTPYCLTNSGLGLSSGSWIDADQFRCYTTEGEGLFIKFETSGIVQLNDKMHTVINTKLVQKYKQQWMEEQMKAEDQDLVSVSDAIPYLWGAADDSNHIFTAIYFGMRPMIDIHYRPNSLEDASLAFILHRDRGVDVDSLCQNIGTYVNDPDFFFLKPVRGLVRDALQYLVEDDNMEPMSTWISKLEKYLEVEPIASSANLTRAIYSEPNVIAARILVNADIELEYYKIKGHPITSACELAKTALQLNYISNILNYALQLADEEFVEFNEQDIMVLLLLTDSAMLFGQETVVKQCLALYKRLQEKFVDLDLEYEIAYATSFDPCDAPQDRKAREKCPVCDELVNIIEGGLVAQCNAGHFWELCSMTKRVLYAPNTRKCITCGSKSLQPTNQKKTLTDIILTNCWKCIYCGSGLLDS